MCLPADDITLSSFYPCRHPLDGNLLLAAMLIGARLRAFRVANSAYAAYDGVNALADETTEDSNCT